MDEAGATPLASAEVARLETRIWLRVGLANLGGALPLVILGGAFVRRFHPRPTPIPLFWLGVLMTSVLFVLMAATTRILLHRVIRKATTWTDNAGPQSAAEVTATTRLPLSIAALSAPWWALALVLAVAIIEGLHAAPNLSGVVVGCIGIVLGGLVACTLSYLAAEDALRPLFAAGLAHGDRDFAKGLGLRGRLIAYWLVGSGAYLLGIALILETFSAAMGRFVGIVCCALGAGVGLTVTNLSAGSVTRPLNTLRAGLRRVAGGDLDVIVDVDDPGDVGQLQSAFNRMVAGLRERERLRRAFGRHVGEDVVRRALEHNASPFAAELTATVLFVDMVGSTTFAAEREPRAVVDMLNDFFAAIVSTIGDHGGSVTQFQGDGALCVFGAPVPVSDHASRGLRAALRLRSEIERLAETYPSFDAAVGVSSGRMVAGDVGTEDRHEYTLIGDPVNEASRLCDEAKRHPARVIASRTTVAACPQPVDEWLCCGEVDLRGRPKPTVVYEPARM